MNQNNFNKEPKVDATQRERPLQKSMLLPDTLGHSLSPNARINALQFSAYTPMKKSLVNSPQNQPNGNTNINYNQNSFTFNQGTLNFQQTNPIPSIYESRMSAQTETANQSYTLKSLLSPYKNEMKGEQSPEDLPRMYAKNQKHSLIINEGKINSGTVLNNDSLVTQIINQIKDKHLPAILSKLKKQIYDDVHNIRLEFQSLREEMRSTVKKQDTIINQMRFNTGNGTNNQAMNSMPKPKHDRQDQLAELQTHYFLMQGKLTQIDAKLNENSKIIFQQLEKITQKLQSQQKVPQIRPSIIKSIFSPILLEYRESFAIKKSQNGRVNEEEEIILNKSIYFIDKFGYLMDNENRYLIDHTGVQIRLEDKHLKMLESHRILQR